MVHILGEDDSGILRIRSGDDQTIPKRQLVIFPDLAGMQNDGSVVQHQLPCQVVPDQSAGEIAGNVLHVIYV